MAVRLRPWLLGTGLVCALIAVAKLPPAPEARAPRFWREATPTREGQIQRALSVARRQLFLATRRDSLVRLTRARGARTGEPVFLNQLPVPPATRRAIDSTLTATWRQLGSTSPDIYVGVVAVEYGLRLQLLPPATDGHTCIVQIPVDWELRWITRSVEQPRFEELAPWLRSGLGPCAFYAAFGTPGAAVERWLVDRRFDLAYDMDWMLPAPPRRWFERGDLAETNARLAQAIAFWQLDGRYSASLDAIACNDGKLARCRAALFAPDSSTLGDLPQIDPPGVIAYSWWDSRSTLYGGRRYLADLIREFGRERFQAFWRSPLPVDSAFQAAMGVPIEAWTARWQRERMGGLRVGSGIRASSALVALLVAGLFVAGGALFSRRRQVA